MKHNTLSRRDFLTGGLKQARNQMRLRAESNPGEKNQTQPGAAFVPDINSDMAPELLAFEAERLGLDPEDREGVLKALQNSMARNI